MQMSNPTPTKKTWRSPIKLSRLTPKKKATAVDENAKPSCNVQQAAAATHAAKAKFYEAQAAAAAAAEASAKAKAKAEAAAAAASEAEARADFLASSRPPCLLVGASATAAKKEEPLDADLIASALPPSIDWKGRCQMLLNDIRAYREHPKAKDDHNSKEEERVAVSSAATSEAQLTSHATSKSASLWRLVALAVCSISAVMAHTAAQSLAPPPLASRHWSWAAGCVASNEVTLSCRLGLPTSEDRDICRGLSEAPREAPRKMRRIPKLSPDHLDRW